MRKVFLIFICLIFTVGATTPNTGYKGTLPNIESDFAYKRNQPAESTPPYTPDENNDAQIDLKTIPRNDKQYVQIIIKKDKTSKYVNDTNTIIDILEKLDKCIQTDNDIQNFNAIVSNLIDNIAYLHDEYYNKPESKYISYKVLMSLSQEARKTATLRSQSQIYTKYLPYSSSGSMFRPQKIQQQVDSLRHSIEQTLYVLKNLD